MIPTFTKKYVNDDVEGDLRVGWASWDNGKYTDRSIKYAYKTKKGKISRGSPELPFYILIDMVEFAYEQGELDKDSLLSKIVKVVVSAYQQGKLEQGEIKKIKDAFCEKKDLQETSK